MMLEKKKYSLLFILVTAVLLLSSGCLYPYPPVYTFGSVEITTNPPGAKIFLDSMDTGYFTPYTLSNVLTGTHNIKLTLTGYSNYSNTINVTAHQTAKLNINLTLAPSAVFLVRISVSPSNINLMVGESKAIDSVTAYYSDNSTADIPLANCTFEPYHTYDPTCTTVNSSGVITGIAAGTTLILVVYEEGAISKIDTVKVTVSATT